MLDILYIHPLGQNPSFSKCYFSKKNKNNAEHFFGFIPMGIIGIVNNLLKNNISVKGINLPLKLRVNPSFHLESYLKTTNPKIVLIDAHWHVHIKNAIELANICKRSIDCKVVFGGLSSTLFYKQLIALPEIDFVVKGDAEKPLLQLAKSILEKKENKKIPNIAAKGFDNKIGYFCADINNYDYVNLDFLEDKDAYLNMFDFWLLVGKGCPFACENCDGNHASVNIIGKNRLILRVPKKIVDDLKNIKSETVAFSLDMSLLPKEIIMEISKNRFNLNLRHEFFHLANVTQMKKIKTSFRSFDLVFSPDFGSDKERKRYGKNFTNKEFLTNLKELREENFPGGVIVYFTDYLISPRKTAKTDEKTRNTLIKQIKTIFPDAIIEVLPWVVDPGTLSGIMKIKEIFNSYTT